MNDDPYCYSIEGDMLMGAVGALVFLVTFKVVLAFLC